MLGRWLGPRREDSIGDSIWNEDFLVLSTLVGWTGLEEPEVRNRLGGMVSKRESRTGSELEGCVGGVAVRIFESELKRNGWEINGQIVREKPTKID